MTVSATVAAAVPALEAAQRDAASTASDAAGAPSDACDAFLGSEACPNVDAALCEHKPRETAAQAAAGSGSEPDSDSGSGPVKHRSGLGALWHGDCLDVMRAMDAESFKAVITSPPYNLRNTTGGFFSRKDKGSRWHRSKLRTGHGYSTHDDAMPHDDYVAWQRECLTEMMRVLRPDGAIFYIHKWRTQGGLLQDRSDIVDGFPVRQIVIWERPGGVNHNIAFFLPTYEVIYVIAKPEFRLLPGENKHGTVWRFAPAAQNPHPAPFPLSLPLRLLASIGPGPVLDPFMGSGTTAVAAERLQREWAGAETAADYCQMALERLDVEARQQRLF